MGRRLLLCLALVGGCLGGPGESAPPPAPAVAVTVAPPAALVELGRTVDFSATVANASDPAVAWEVLGGAANGTVDEQGLFTAPASMPANAAVTVRCISVEDAAATDEATVTLVAPPPPAPPGLPLDLRVATRGGWVGSPMPVTSGVPLVKGSVSDPSTLRLRDAAGADRPAQFRPLSRWADGSIRVLLVDFLASSEGTYTLATAAAAPPPAGTLAVSESGSAIDVDTGPLRFRVSKGAFRLLESVRIDRDGDGQVDDECLDPASLEGIVVDDGGTAYRTDRVAPDSIAVEEQGPVRVCIRVAGRHRASAGGADKLRFIVRIHAWAGLPYVKVVYSFRNLARSGEPAGDNAAQAAQLASLVEADSIRVDLPLRMPAAPAAIFGGDPADHLTGTLASGQTATLFQTYTGAYDATDSNNPQPAGYDAGSGDGSSVPLTNAWAIEGPEKIAYALTGAASGSGAHAPGFVQVAAGSGADRLRVTAALREFWQLHPKTLVASGSGLLRVGIWPAEAWRLQVFEGAMKTHEVLYSFERADALSAGSARTLSRLADDAPFAAPAPVHWKATRLFGDIGTTDAAMTDVSACQPAHQARVAAYLEEFRDHFGDLVADRAHGPPLGNEYGMWHYGDGKTTDGEGAWENQHWSISRACFVWFAASGNRDLLAFGDAALRHFRDVDVIHSDVGRRYAYSEPGNPSVTPHGTSQAGKTRYNPNNKQHDLGNYHVGSMNFETFKGEMLGDHYLLYGDGLSLEVLAEAFSYLRGTWKRFFDPNHGGVDETRDCSERWISNAMFVAMSYHACTGSAEAKAMADFVLARAKARQSATGPRDPSGKGFAAGGGFFQSWMCGHMIEALEAWRWTMEDATLDGNVRDAMEWLLSPDAGVYDGNGGFGETPGDTSNYGSINLMIGAGYAGALRATGDNLWRTRAAQFLDASLPELQATLLGVNHKSTAQRFRAGPALLRAFQD